MRPGIIRGAIAGVMVMAAAVSFQSPAFAQAYPSQQVRIIVPLAAGGSIDGLARTLADKLKDRFGQIVLVENKPGAGTAIGTEYVAKAKPDGYTMLFAGSNAFYFKYTNKLDFDPNKELMPVALVDAIPLVFAVHPSIPAKNMMELVAHLKANPGKLNAGIVGYGIADHLAGELLMARTGTKMENILMKGSAAITPELIAGRIQVRVDALGTMKPLHDSGKVRILALTTTPRSSLAPDIPTVEESGFPNFNLGATTVVAVPSGTPAAIAERINRDISATVRDPEMDKKIKSLGFEPMTASVAQVGEMMRRDDATFGKLIRDLGIQPQ